MKLCVQRLQIFGPHRATDINNISAYKTPAESLNQKRLTILTFDIIEFYRNQRAQIVLFVGVGKEVAEETLVRII